MKPNKSKFGGRILSGYVLYGDEARKVATWLGLEPQGEQSSYHTTVYFYYKSVEGHPVLEVEIE